MITKRVISESNEAQRRSSNVCISVSGGFSSLATDSDRIQLINHHLCLTAGLWRRSTEPPEPYHIISISISNHIIS